MGKYADVEFDTCGIWEGKPASIALLLALFRALEAQEE